jgi:tetratricopeptide (TPR) repeat protein
MMNLQDATQRTTASRSKRGDLLLVMTILLALASVVSLSRWIEAKRPPVDVAQEEERLYVTGPAIKRMSLGFNGLVADWYWMRALQYVGRKALNHPGRIQLDDLSALNLRLLAPLLDTATTLDPQFMAVYDFGAVVLPAVDDRDAIALLEKGIAANPSAWRLYQHLGYIYWQRGDYTVASRIYGEGAELAGAPIWMKQMSAQMAAEGGSRATARQIYLNMLEQSEDEKIRELAARRLAQVYSFDERDAIRKVLNEYSARTGRCASTWKDVTLALANARFKVDGGEQQLSLNLDASTGAPVDPAGMPYRLVKDGCDVDLEPTSTVPYK